MKRIQKKTVLKTKDENNLEGQEQKQTVHNIAIKNPIISQEKKAYNYSENQIHKKYSKQLENQRQNNKKEDNYLDSDLEDSDNKKIYENVVQRLKRNEIFQNNQSRDYANYSNLKKNISVELHAPINISNKNQNQNTKNNVNTITQRKNVYNPNPNKAETYNKRYSNRINDKNTNNTNNNNANTSGYKYNYNNKDNKRIIEKKNSTSIYIDRRNKHKEKPKNEEIKNACNLRRQTIERGGKYNNVQVTHIIYSKKNIDFHIVEPMEVNMDLKTKYSANIGSINKISSTNHRRTSSISYKSSVDGINIKPKEKKPNVGKTTVIYHCSEVKQKKDTDKKNKNNNKGAVNRNKNDKNISSIPRSNQYSQPNNYKTERKYKYTNPIFKDNNTDNKRNTNANISNYIQATYYKNNNTSNNNYKKEDKNQPISTNTQLYNTPVKTYNNNYTTVNNTNSTNNNRYNQYNQNNKNAHVKKEIAPRNLNNAQIKPVTNQIKDNNKNNQIKIDTKKYNDKKNTSIEIGEEIKKPKNLKTDTKTNDYNKYIKYNQKNAPKIEVKKNEEKKKENKKEDEKGFLLKNYYKIFKNKTKDNKKESEYEKWFKRNCDNNNDVSKKNITNKYLDYIPNLNKNRDDVQKMPYDEWFNRNCEKSENIQKKQIKENEKKKIFNKVQNMLDTINKNNDNINNELKKLDINEQKQILKNLRSSTDNIINKKKIDNLLDSCIKKKKEDEKIKLIKSAKDKETKKLYENLIDLWEDEKNLPKNEKDIKFEKLNKLFKNKKKNDIIDELNNLDNNDKNEAIDYLKLKNKTKKKEIDEISNLSDKKKKIDVLVNALAGKTENKADKKEKLKKILDILLNLDKKSKNDCVTYLRNTAEEDEKKNEDLLSIINELPSEEKEEYDNFDKDKENYSYSYSTSFEKYFDNISRKNTEDIKVHQSKDTLNEDENGDLKLLDDDIIDIINEIQNDKENTKKQLDEEEFNDFADNMICHLYENNNMEDEDFTENDEDIKIIVNSLNNVNKSDCIKTFDILKQKADDEAKKKRLSCLTNKIKAIAKARRLFKNIIDKQDEEEKKELENWENFIGDLESQNTIYLNNTDEENKSKINTSNIKEKEKDLLKNAIKSLELDRKNLMFEKLRNSATFPGKKGRLSAIFKKVKNLNKITKSKINYLKEKAIKEDEENKESLDENKLKEIIKEIINDLYEEKEKPLTRKEIRENEEENNEKLKEISKVINNMNYHDQNIVMDKLKAKANNEFKKSQFNRLSTLIKNVNNVKTYVQSLQKTDDEFGNLINSDENKKVLSKSELEELKNNLKNNLSVDDLRYTSDNPENNDESLSKIADIITHLNQDQQKQILNSIKQKDYSKEKEEKFNKLIAKIYYLNKMKKLAKSINIEKSNLRETIKNKEALDNKSTNELEPQIKLEDEDLIKLTEAILKNIFNKSPKEIDKQNIHLTEAEEYLLKNEQEKKLENTVRIINKLDKKDKEKISGILAYILDNDEQIKQLNILNKKAGIYNDIENKENLIKIIEDYKKDNNTEELKDNKLAKLTEELITDLLKDNFLDDKNEKMDKLNKAANTIILMNKKDQEKILDTLNNFAKTENQKETMEKLNRLVENLIYMNFYLFNINRQHKVDKNLNKNLDLNLDMNKDLKSADFKNFNVIKKSVVSEIFDEQEELNYDENKNSQKKMNKIALKLSTLNNNNQEEILTDINKRYHENENKNVKKAVEDLNENLKIIKMKNIFSSVIVKKQKNQFKNKLGDNTIKRIVDNLNDTLIKNKSPNNYTEQLLFNNHKQQKINKFTNSLIHFDDETKRKTMNYLSKNIINNNHKKEINKLTDSIMNKNNLNLDKNIFSSQFFMINTLENTDLNENELNLLIETFCKDLFTEDLQDINKKEENMNLICNIIKELDENNQDKVLEKLRDRPEARDKSDLLDNLEENIIKLRILKDELIDEQKDNCLIDPNKSVVSNDSNEDDLLEFEEESVESVTLEITVDDIGQDELNELCQVFTVDYTDNKESDSKKKEALPKKNISSNKSIKALANSLIMLDSLAQKKITDKLEESCKNKNEKEQFNLLKERIDKLNTYKKYGDEIKQKMKEENKNFEDKIKIIEQLNDCSNNNLDKEKLDEIEKEIVNDLFNKEETELDKNKDINNYLLEARNEILINNSGKKINKLSIEDKNTILKKLENLADDEDKKNKFNKLCKVLNNLEKIKQIYDKIKINENQISSKDSNNFNSQINLSADKLENIKKEIEKKLFNESDEDFINNHLSDDIAEKIMKLNDNNQDLILKKLEEKAEDDEKKERLKKLNRVLDKLKIFQKFTKKVRDLHLSKIALEKLENEKKYGIVILKNEEKEENPTILMKKPEELSEDKLSEITNILIDDLNKINKEENDNTDIPYIDRYLKDKENEKVFENIADVLNSLDNKDKSNILEEIKNNFDKPKKNKIYNRFKKILAKKERQFDEEKRKIKRDAIKEIENEKNSDDNLLYSIIRDNNENSTIDMENIGEQNIKQSEKKWTRRIGRLETDEIY